MVWWEFQGAGAILEAAYYTVQLQENECVYLQFFLQLENGFNNACLGFEVRNKCRVLGTYQLISW